MHGGICDPRCGNDNEDHSALPIVLMEHTHDLCWDSMPFQIC